MKKSVPPSSNVHTLGHTGRSRECVSELLRAVRESLSSSTEDDAPASESTATVLEGQTVEGNSNVQLAGNLGGTQTIHGNNNIQISGLQLVVSVNLGKKVSP